MFLMSKFRCVTLFLHISTSQLFALACYEISFSPITVFFFLLSPSLRQHTVYRCHYSSEEKGRVHLCDSMKQVTSIQGSDECFPITAHHSTQRPLYSLYIYPRPPQRDFFLASCITANGEIEIKIRTTERLQKAICGIWLQIHQGRVLLNDFGGEKEQCENWLTS